MRRWAVALGALLIGCSEGEAFPAEDVPAAEDIGSAVDTGFDTGRTDTGSPDAGSVDVGALDTGRADVGALDAGALDAGGADVRAADAGDAGLIFFSTGAIVTTGSAGSTAGGVSFSDDCLTGEAMVGFEGVLGTDNYITQIAVLCSPLRIEGDRVRTGATTTLPRRGMNPGSAISLRYPADQLLVGFEGRAGGLVDQLRFACAPYTVAAADGGRVAVRGTVALTDPVGGSGGAPFARIACEDGAAQGASIRAGDGVDSFALRCAAIVVR